jgi:hypothetical protein
MTPDELAKEVAKVIQQAASRVGPNSIGAQQYYVEGEPQKFETVDWAKWFEYMREEWLDTINYSVMMCIRLNRLEYGFNEASIHSAGKVPGSRTADGRSPDAAGRSTDLY